MIKNIAFSAFLVLSTITANCSIEARGHSHSTLIEGQQHTTIAPVTEITEAQTQALVELIRKEEVKKGLLLCLREAGHLAMFLKNAELLIKQDGSVAFLFTLDSDLITKKMQEDMTLQREMNSLQNQLMQLISNITLTVAPVVINVVLQTVISRVIGH